MCLCQATTKSRGSLGPMSWAVLGMCEGALLRPGREQFISGALVYVHTALLQVLCSSFSHRPRHHSDISKCLLWLWPQLGRMSLAALCPVIDFIPRVSTNTLLRGTKALLWGGPLAFWQGDGCTKCTINSLWATSVRSGNCPCKKFK